MKPAELQEYLRTRIPLAQAMGVEVRSLGDGGIELFAPLAPNTNHRDTVFGGSASAVAILAAWSALHVRMRAEGLDGRIVIHSNTIHYERPIVADFTARASPPPPADWEKLAATLRRSRMARARVAATLHCEGEQVGRLEAEFAVVPLAAT